MTMNYKPLTDPSKSLRLLTIVEGNNADVIECNLHHVKDNVDAYTCLSYTWGEATPADKISLDGQDVSIRPNLWNFLHTARRYGITDRLWIDAICINQTDINEKNQQVARMGEIYERAERTIIWLGLNDVQASSLYRLSTLMKGIRPSSSLMPDEAWHRFCQALDHAQQGNSVWPEPTGDVSRLHFVCGAIYTSPLQPIEHYPYWSVMKNTVPRLPSALQPEDALVWRQYLGLNDAISALENSSYWSRAWIRQEILLSRRPEIVSPIGNAGIALLLMFQDAWKIRRRRDSFEADEDLLIDVAINEDVDRNDHHLTMLQTELYVRHGLHQKGPLATANSISKMLRTTIRAGCSDVRDRVYSILSLAEDGSDFSVNYAEDSKSLFLRILDTHIRSNGMRIDRLLYALIRSCFEALELEPIGELISLKQLRKMPTKASRVYWIKHEPTFRENLEHEEWLSGIAVVLLLYSSEGEVLVEMPLERASQHRMVLMWQDELVRQHLVSPESNVRKIKDKIMSVTRMS